MSIKTKQASITRPAVNMAGRSIPRLKMAPWYGPKPKGCGKPLEHPAAVGINAGRRGWRQAESDNDGYISKRSHNSEEMRFLGISRKLSTSNKNMERETWPGGESQPKCR